MSWITWVIVLGIFLIEFVAWTIVRAGRDYDGR